MVFHVSNEIRTAAAATTTTKDIPSFCHVSEATTTVEYLPNRTCDILTAHKPMYTTNTISNTHAHACIFVYAKTTTH